MKARGPGELAGIKQSGIPSFSFLNVVDDFKIFVVARDDAKHIMEHSKDEAYKYIISRAEKEVSKSPLIKG